MFLKLTFFLLQIADLPGQHQPPNAQTLHTTTVPQPEHPLSIPGQQVCIHPLRPPMSAITTQSLHPPVTQPFHSIATTTQHLHPPTATTMTQPLQPPATTTKQPTHPQVATKAQSACSPPAKSLPFHTKKQVPSDRVTKQSVRLIYFLEFQKHSLL